MIDFSRLYRELHTDPRCSLEAFKHAYRRRVAELHPDRTPGDLSAVATLKEINLCYAAALDFHRRHGRLPGSVPLAPIAAGSANRPRTPGTKGVARSGTDADPASALSSSPLRRQAAPCPAAERPRFLHSRRFWVATGILLLAAVWYFEQVRSEDRIPRQQSGSAPAERGWDPGDRLASRALRLSPGRPSRWSCECRSRLRSARA